MLLPGVYWLRAPLDHLRRQRLPVQLWVATLHWRRRRNSGHASWWRRRGWWCSTSSGNRHGRRRRWNCCRWRWRRRWNRHACHFVTLRLHLHRRRCLGTVHLHRRRRHISGWSPGSRRRLNRRSRWRRLCNGRILHLRHRGRRVGVGHYRWLWRRRRWDAHGARLSLRRYGSVCGVWRLWRSRGPHLADIDGRWIARCLRVVRRDRRGRRRHLGPANLLLLLRLDVNRNHLSHWSWSWSSWSWSRQIHLRDVNEA